METENIICTSSSPINSIINNSNINFNYSLNNMPLACLVIITNYIDNDKNSLKYRIICKKFNEAIQIKLYLKSKENDLVFYKKCFMILNSNCHKYYMDNIYPFLLNADTVYEFLNYNNEKTFNDLFNYSLNELNKLINTNEIKINQNNFESTFKQSIIRFLVSIILINFKEEDYDSLDFNKLEPYEEAKEMILLIVRLMKNLNYLDLSYSIINDDKFLFKLIDKIESKDKFTLNLEGINLNSDLVKKIKVITDKNINIIVTINKKYNGQMQTLGGKKMNKPRNMNKKKFKNIEFK